MHPTSKWIISKLKEGLKLYGEYSYYDKGPDEVMDVDEIEDKLKELSKEELAEVYKDLCAYEHGSHLVEHIELFDDLFQQDNPPRPVISTIKVTPLADIITALKRK